MRICLIIFLFAFGISASFSQSTKDLIRKGNSKYKERKYEDSEILYRKALERDSADNRAKYNLGNALYKQNKFNEARQKYLDVMPRAKSSFDESKVLYNIGNTFLKEKKYAESLDYYKKALKLNPRDFDAKYNLEYARRMLLLEQQNQSQSKENQQNYKQKNQSQASNQQNKQQEQKNQQQQDQKKENQKQQNQQLSKSNIENILNALRNEEKKTQKEIKAKLLPRRERKIEKNW
jgi:Ca-activated chloride channel family protein